VRTISFVLCLGILLTARGVGAQGTAPPIVQFSFSNPGARSLGFGGAFVALADDATAAFANPAGLVQLSRPEVSMEGRGWNYSTPFSAGGRVSGQPTGNLLDTTPGPRAGVSSESVSGLSFLSLAYPGKDWSVAFFRHQTADFEAATESQGFFSDVLEPDDILQISSSREGSTFRIPDLRTLLDLEIVTFGIAGAYQVTETFSIGAGLSHFDSVFTSKSGIFASVERNLPQGTFGPSAYSEGAEVMSAEIATTDNTGWGLTGGFLWRISPRWSAGGFYRQGPSLEITSREETGPFLEPAVPSGTVLFLGSSPLGFPDVYGLGTAYKSPTGAVTVSFEWDRVQYSTVARSMDQGALDTQGLELDDGDEIHLGLEYVFIESDPILALRLGAWRDPDHQLRYVGDDPIVRALLRPGEDELHFALGFGMAFRKFQFDLGIDLSSLVKTASISAIYFF